MGQIQIKLRPYSGIAAVLGLISFALAGLVSLFLRDLRFSFWALILLGGLLLFVFVIGAFGKISAALFGRRARYGTNTLAMVTVFTGIVILVNILGAIVHRRYDFTASAQFTLTPQTKRVMAEMKQPVKATGFFSNEFFLQAMKREVEYLLTEYRYHNRMFSFEFVDPEVKPALAKEYQIKENGTIIFESKGRRKGLILVEGQIFTNGEQIFTSAILEVTGVLQKRVCFLTEHGERDIFSQKPEGYSRVRTGLLQELYKVEVLKLGDRSELPEDCTVLVIAGARKPFTVSERQIIEGYLSNSGKILVLADPNSPGELADILAAWGIMVMKGIVIDPGAHVSPDTTTPAVIRGSYTPVVITRHLDSTYFPEATALGLTEGWATMPAEEGRGKVKWPLTPVTSPNLVILPFAVTSLGSWLEMDSADRKFTEGVDVKGPLALGVMVIGSAPVGQTAESRQRHSQNQSQNPNQGQSLGLDQSRKNSLMTPVEEKLTRLVVLGDSDFATNQHYPNGGNSDLFLNAIHWLAEEESLISIRPKPYTFRRLVISQAALRFLRYGSIWLLPLFLLILAGICWWRRR